MPSRTRLLLLFAMKKTLALLMLLAGLTVGAQGRTLTWDGSDSIHDWSYQNWLDQNHEHVTFNYGDDVRFLDFGSRMVTLSFKCASRSVDVKSNLELHFWWVGERGYPQSLHTNCVHPTFLWDTCRTQHFFEFYPLTNSGKHVH